MAEPVSSAGAAVVTGMVSGLALGTVVSKPNVAMLSGVFCGAVVFLLRSKEPHWIKKALYFCISLVGGYAIAPDVQLAFGWLPAWLAAFFSAAAVVAVAVIVLDWSERAIPQVLNRLVDRLMGGDPGE
ncbi:putative holin [Cupriavidus alkaliphilus]|uniref:putative holin n=1 Tax=Cupriavidus alkaliphilus TaxID=942866 RepID=UPI001615ADF0|nr:putative holin [Cupriavidus alkaliphilus]MBB2918347.1 uncharacterized membrane protein HdeD (DUF308 family) [Cupriavidus alkaliphilus]